MYNVNEWLCFTDALDKKTCKKLIKLGKEKWTSGGTKSKKQRYKRVSDIVWINDQWIYNTIWPYMEQANEEAGWKYDIRAAEQMQITRYKKGGFYYFHKDGKGDHLSTYDEPDNEFMHGYVRKLSMTVLLNDNYGGGEFQFASLDQEECTIETPEFNKIGSIIVFPSDMEHRVTPVTKGIRYSLVVWFLGPPFK